MVSCPAPLLVAPILCKRYALESGMCSLGMEQYTFLPDVYYDFVASHTFQALSSWLNQQVTLILWFLMQ
jgi:hypothetical protein